MLIYFPVHFQFNICHYIINAASGTPKLSSFRHRLSHRHGNNFTQCLSECPEAEFVVLRFLNSFGGSFSHRRECNDFDNECPLKYDTCNSILDLLELIVMVSLSDFFDVFM